MMGKSLGKIMSANVGDASGFCSVIIKVGRLYLREFVRLL